MTLTRKRRRRRRRRRRWTGQRGAQQELR